jgi:hypothetical protein
VAVNLKEIAMRTYRAFAVSIAASVAMATAAVAATVAPNDSGRLLNQYSDWAGGKSNADALISGLHGATPVTIVTSGPNSTVSIAGFTPSAPMSYSAIGSALGNAQRSLSRLGITRPTAEQIQAALIGGEILLPGGNTTLVRGSVMPRGGEPGPLAIR